MVFIYWSFNLELQIRLQIHLKNDYIATDKMSYIFLLKLRNFIYVYGIFKQNIEISF